MPDLALLHQMINDAAKLALIDNYGKKSETLADVQSPDSKVDNYRFAEKCHNTQDGSFPGTERAV